MSFIYNYVTPPVNERVYQALHEVADTPAHIQRDDISWEAMLDLSLLRHVGNI